MKTFRKRLSLPALIAALGTTIAAPASLSEDAEDLRPVATFASIADEAERSAALFSEAGKVLLHPRCVNCHPAGDAPLQGEAGDAHEPPVRRGVGGMGVVGMRCTTCHLDENFDPGRVPGDPHWRLAPRKMAWEGLTLGEICAQIKDPERNGRRDLEAIVEHMTGDSLVGWAWTPGAGRQPAPGSWQAFGDLVRAWAETGAVCPGAAQGRAAR